MINYSGVSDFQLVQLAQAGNVNAYNGLLSRYHQKIKQTIYFYVSDHFYVNDLVQEVLLKIFRHLPEFKNDSEFSTWMYRIIQNTIKNYFRGQTPSLDFEIQLNEEALPTTFSPEYELMSVELASLLESAISELSDDLRRCYDMHLFEEQTYETIAQRMHCPIGTVRSRIFRARKFVMDFVESKQNK